MNSTLNPIDKVFTLSRHLYKCVALENALVQRLDHKKYGVRMHVIHEI